MIPDKHLNLTPDLIRKDIKEAENRMRRLPQVVIEPEHHFAEGLYGRAILIPKDTFLTGKIHKQADLQIMVSGDIMVLTEDGFRRYQGYHVFPGRAGTKQIGYALEDTQWITVHRTDTTDLDQLEDELYLDEPEILDFKTGEQLVDVAHLQEDFNLMLEELMVTAEVVQEQSENYADQVLIELDGVRVGPSCVHGQGILTTRDLEAGELVGMARLGPMRTQLGRYVNHSPEPNCEMRWIDGDIGLITLCRVSARRELFVNYRQSVQLIKGGVR